MRICLLIVMGVLPGAGYTASAQNQPASPAVAPAEANSSNDAVFNEMEEELARSGARGGPAGARKPVHVRRERCDVLLGP